jgi:hypothetical protein
MTSEQLSELKLSTLNRICQGEGAVELPVLAENPTQPPVTKGNMCGRSALSLRTLDPILLSSRYVNEARRRLVACSDILRS